MSPALAPAQVDGDGKLGLLHDRRRPRFVVRTGTHAVPANQHIPDPDIQLVLIQPHPGITDRTRNPSPVRVTAKKGGLDQRGIGHGPGDLPGILIRSGAPDKNINHPGRPLAVLDAHPGQLAQRLTDCGLEGPEVAARLCDRPVVGQTVGHQHQRVAGTGIPVHADGVKRIAQRHVQGLAQGVGLDRSVGHDIAQHGRHIGVDHARTFGQTGQGHGLAAKRQLTDRRLGKGIGRHYARQRVPKAPGRERVARLDNPGPHFFPRRQNTDLAGRRRQHQALVNAQLAADQTTRVVGQTQARPTGRDVGNPAVDHHSLELAALHPLQADQHRRALDLIGGKGGHSGGRTVRHDQGQILFPARLDAARDAAETKAGHHHRFFFDLDPHAALLCPVTLLVFSAAAARTRLVTPDLGLVSAHLLDRG